MKSYFRMLLETAWIPALGIGMLFAIIFTLASCSKEGELQNQSKQEIIINGKEYRFIKVVPADGERAVWLLVPKDSTVELPKSISWNYSCGKNCTATQTVFML